MIKPARGRAGWASRSGRRRWGDRSLRWGGAWAAAQRRWAGGRCGRAGGVDLASLGPRFSHAAGGRAGGVSLLARGGGSRAHTRSKAAAAPQVPGTGSSRARASAQVQSNQSATGGRRAGGRAVGVSLPVRAVRRGGARPRACSAEAKGGGTLAHSGAPGIMIFGERQGVVLVSLSSLSSDKVSSGNTT